MSRLALRPTKAYSTTDNGVFFPRVKVLGRGVDHQTPSGAKIMKEWAIFLHLVCALMAYFGVTYTFIFSERRRRSVLFVPDTNFVV